jgi:hypothetical protein
VHYSILLQFRIEWNLLFDITRVYAVHPQLGD